MKLFIVALGTLLVAKATMSENNYDTSSGSKHRLRNISPQTGREEKQQRMETPPYRAPARSSLKSGRYEKGNVHLPQKNPKID